MVKDYHLHKISHQFLPILADGVSLVEKMNLDKEIKVKNMVADIYDRYIIGLPVKSELEYLMQFMDFGEMA